MSQEIGVGGAKFGRGRGKFEVVFAEASEEGPDAVGVGSGVGVEDDDVIEVVGTRSRSLITLLMTLTNHPRKAVLPWGMTSQTKSRAGVQNVVRWMVPLSMVIWWKKEEE